ncbi:hypothetical protein A2477_04850 [Candidatus Falkowbacteria bacterium RIFOXYC2_FULL_47_12]|uniref:Heat-inducible transcription repressor HrcA C-terminal domain-containing protein n=2 Tax=Candidatus Falkowiibacteriota TaxID=1752728 RepID=A0A1F5TMC5_9BACT|nr:MAG: hypothetical protein A2242_01570 [Candidatus Falkowbacteria bacterium RIFOXYA2_FULL_47_9]OGF40070.1 MAG: hypothetical protein A2477_04850 [Candidatus Falkowbacteria bacterium RIFOXYC2_FULL_47_12]
MEPRQQELLKIIVKEYIKTAEPISSGLLVEKFKLPYSSATVRSEMAQLEEQGYIAQPHTSAGRVPTESAYQFYIDNFLSGRKASVSAKIKHTDERSFKQAARELAEKSGLAVFWAFHQNNLYFTGISNLLSQPEFVEAQRVIDVSRIIDQMEDIIQKIYKSIPMEGKILVGEDNPFGSVCGSVLAKYKHEAGSGMFGIIGPMRMDYDKCWGLVNCIKEQL